MNQNENQKDNRRRLDNLIETDYSMCRFLEEIENNNKTNSEKHFATAPEIARARGEYGWDTIFGILVGPCSSSQIIVNPKRDAVYVIHGNGPITSNRLNEALTSSSPKKHFVSTQNDNRYDGLILTDDEANKIFTNYTPEMYKRHNPETYTLSQLKKIKSKEYAYNELLAIEPHTFAVNKLDFVYPQALILNILTRGNVDIAKNYLYQLIKENIHDSSSGYSVVTESNKIQVNNPFENLDVKKPFASMIAFYGEFGNGQDVGFAFNRLYDKQYGLCDTMLQVEKSVKLEEEKDKFNIAQAYLIAREFIPPVLIKQYEKKLYTEWQNLSRENL
jgi:hypothetical protein